MIRVEQGYGGVNTVGGQSGNVVVVDVGQTNENAYVGKEGSWTEFGDVADECQGNQDADLDCDQDRSGHWR